MGENFECFECATALVYWYGETESIFAENFMDDGNNQFSGAIAMEMVVYDVIIPDL